MCLHYSQCSSERLKIKYDDPSLQVACMQFINIVVHSVENMNFRVHLQYEFTHHGLDQYLEVNSPFILLISLLKMEPSQPQNQLLETEMKPS